VGDHFTFVVHVYPRLILHQTASGRPLVRPPGIPHTRQTLIIFIIFKYLKAQGYS
jgi:hypothetical protein